MSAALDMSIEAMDADSVPELPAKRVEKPTKFGGGEVASLLIALGRRSPDDFPQWVGHNARTVRLPNKHKSPWLFAYKAGLREKPKSKSYQEAGLRLEPMVFDAWVRELEAGRRTPDEAWLDSPQLESRILDGYPQQLRPKVWQTRFEDPKCSALAVYLDGWARDAFDGLVDVSIKTSMRSHDHLQPQYALQSQACIMAGEFAYSVVVLGECWAADYRNCPPEDRGPLKRWTVRPDAKLQQEIRDACDEGFEKVEELKTWAREQGL